MSLNINFHSIFIFIHIDNNWKVKEVQAKYKY